MIVNYRKLSKKMTVMAVALLITTGFTLYTLSGCQKVGEDQKALKQKSNEPDPHATSDLKLPESDRAVISVSKDGRVFFTMDGTTNLRSLGEQLNGKHKLGLTEVDIERFSKMNEVGMPLRDLKGFLGLPDVKRGNATQSGIPVQEGHNELYEWLTCAMISNPNVGLFIEADKTTPYSIIKKIWDVPQDDNINRFNLITDTEKIRQLVLPERGTTHGSNPPEYPVEKYVAPVVVLEADENRNENALASGPKVSEKHVLTLVLNDHNKIYWYVGITNAQAYETDYSETGIRRVLQDQTESDDKLVVLIKPYESSTLENFINILDEMAVLSIPRYVLFELDDLDNKIIQRYLTGK